jgi:hypothetical protein
LRFPIRRKDVKASAVAVEEWDSSSSITSLDPITGEPLRKNKPRSLHRRTPPPDHGSSETPSDSSTEDEEDMPLMSWMAR